jgi:hypothetical protein
VNAELGKTKMFTAADIGLSRTSGFPILEKIKDHYLVAWTSGLETRTVKTMKIIL